MSLMQRTVSLSARGQPSKLFRPCLGPPATAPHNQDLTIQPHYIQAAAANGRNFKKWVLKWHGQNFTCKKYFRHLHPSNISLYVISIDFIFFFKFLLQVAKSLFNDECLKPCPRCQHPARCHSVKGEGVCSRADCAFQFCTACLCAFHGSKECGSQSGGRRKKDTLLPGSAQSKRNIRRLWTEITVSVCFVSFILPLFFFFFLCDFVNMRFSNEETDL